MCQNTSQKREGGFVRADSQRGRRDIRNMRQPTLLHPQSGSRERWRLVLSSHPPLCATLDPSSWTDMPTFRVGLPSPVNPFLETDRPKIMFPWGFLNPVLLTVKLYHLSIKFSFTCSTASPCVVCSPRSAQEYPASLETQEGGNSWGLLGEQFNSGNWPWEPSPFKQSMAPYDRTRGRHKTLVHLESPLCHSFFLLSGKQINHN